MAARVPVMVPDLDSPDGRRWPAFTGAALEEGVRGVLAMPITVTSICVGALDRFREAPGPLENDEGAGAVMAAQLAALALLDLIAGGNPDDPWHMDLDGPPGAEDVWAHVADMDRIEVYQATGMLISQLTTNCAALLDVSSAGLLLANERGVPAATALTPNTSTRPPLWPGPSLATHPH